MIQFVRRKGVRRSQNGVEVVSPEIVAHKSKNCNPQVSLHQTHRGRRVSEIEVQDGWQATNRGVDER